MNTHLNAENIYPSNQPHGISETFQHSALMPTADIAVQVARYLAPLSLDTDGTKELSWMLNDSGNDLHYQHSAWSISELE